MTTTPTFEESKHRRAADGKFANSPWSPQHSMSGKARVRIGAAGVAVSAFGVLEGALNLVGAILAVGAASLVAWGGYKGHKRRKRRRAGLAPRPKAGTKVTRYGTVKLTNADDIKAFAEWQQQRWEHRDAKWAPRKAAVKSVAYTLVGKTAPK